jgi:nitrogen fixation/metabolism regulation signal transduction histidine kinase
LAFSVFLLFFLAGKTHFFISAFIIGLLILVQVIFLIIFVERTNTKLSKFLSSIRYADFSTSFSDKGMGKTFEDLSEEFNQIITEFKKYRAEKEEHFNYLQTIVQHVSIGIIAFKRDGKVDIFNNAVKQILGIRNLRNIQELKKMKQDIPEILLKMRAGDKSLIKLYSNDQIYQLSIYATEFRLRGEEYTLISLQDIHSELEEKEIESWQKLIRVLTHEIMNSMTPISSLASTVEDLLFEEENKESKMDNLDEEEVDMLRSAMRTIQSRSQGLLNFVEIYRNLTRIPKPNFRYFYVKELFERSYELMKPKLDKYNIECTSRVFPDDLKITADPDLIDQVVINLMLNAVHAVKDMKQPKIAILATRNSNNRIIIDIKDNGHGVKPDIMDKIFMPFFTSKKEGSGIGLSLSRQIMSLHKGTIAVKSKQGEGAEFTLAF